MNPRFKYYWSCLALILASVIVVPIGATEVAPSTRQVMEDLQGQRGILVHLGCADAGRTLDLHAGGQFLVQALDLDPVKVAGARSFFQSKQAYGAVSANVLSRPALPFADNLINVLVVDTWGKDKGMGFSRGAPPIWHHWVPIRVNAMVPGGNQLYVCGPPDVLQEGDPLAAFEGRLGSRLWALSADDGAIVAQLELDEMPLFDGMIVAEGRLYLCTQSGDIICMGGEE